MKWAIIAVVAVFLLIAGFEITRRSSAPAETEQPGFGETGKGAAVVDRLKPGQWEKPESTPATNTNPEAEFDQADNIQDSREKSLQDAKGKTKVFIDSINNN